MLKAALARRAARSNASAIEEEIAALPFDLYFTSLVYVRRAGFKDKALIFKVCDRSLIHL